MGMSEETTTNIEDKKASLIVTLATTTTTSPSAEARPSAATPVAPKAVLTSVREQTGSYVELDTDRVDTRDGQVIFQSVRPVHCQMWSKNMYKVDISRTRGYLLSCDLRVLPGFEQS